jgi:hypothetical protein
MECPTTFRVIAQGNAAEGGRKGRKRAGIIHQNPGRGAVQAGWGQYDELKEPDFDALRGREDFKMLLAELEAKSGPKAKAKD